MKLSLDVKHQSTDFLYCALIDTGLTATLEILNILTMVNFRTQI